MTIGRMMKRTVAAMCVAVTATSCGFQGVNTLPLPGAVASGSGHLTYHVRITNVGTLESNSPVMLDDVVVGSVGALDVTNWVADVEVRVRPDVVVPANAVAKIGQTSLLGSMHVALDPPVGELPTGRLRPGSTIEVHRSSTYPSTEQTLSSLSMVVTGGGLGQIGDVIHGAASAFGGREVDVRQLLSRIDAFVGTIDGQRDQFGTSIQALERLTATLATQREDVLEALRTIPPALDVLNEQRAQLVAALQLLGEFGDTAAGLVEATQDDLVGNLDNLEPSLRALADVGPNLGTVVAYLPTYPFSQNFIDRAIRGDYINIFATMDLTVGRLKRSMFLGTRWGDPNAPLVPAPGDPVHLSHTYIAPPDLPAAVSDPAAAAPEPLLPITPPPAATTTPESSIFAGPYPGGR